MRCLEQGEDPRRVLPNHRERGPKRFEYTYEDLAELFDMKVEAVYQAVSRGRLDPSNLHSIVAFAQYQISKDRLVS